MRLFLFSLLAWLAAPVLTPLPLAAQAPAIQRFDLYTGFSNLRTPGLNDLSQVGFHFQAGYNLSRWHAAGFDYTVQNGSSAFTPDLTKPALQRQLAAQLPPGYHLSLPFTSTTQSFAAGEQLIIHHFRAVTISVRPVLAAFHTTATLHPRDPIATFVAAGIAPSRRMTDWYGTYGAGGAIEFPVARWLGARAQFDAGWNHPFSNFVDHGGVSYRYSVGPAIHFGPLIRPGRFRTY